MEESGAKAAAEVARHRLLKDMPKWEGTPRRADVSRDATGMLRNRRAGRGNGLTPANSDDFFVWKEISTGGFRDPNESMGPATDGRGFTGWEWLYSRGHFS